MNTHNFTIECTKAHYDEWVLKSGVSPEIAKLNILSIEDPVKIAEFLGWTGYKESAGWICTGIDFNTGKKHAYGQFKPDIPIQFPDKPKPSKYITSKDIVTKKSLHDAILLEMPNDPYYWRKVADDPTAPIFVTEGSKKAGGLLTCGYAGIALEGVEMGFKDGRLVPNLKPFFTKGRSIIFCFDADIIEKEGVEIALVKLADKAKRCGAIPLIALWDISLGKGIDDVLVNHGAEKVCGIIDDAIPYKIWLKSVQPQKKATKATKNDLCDLAKKFSTIQDFYGEKLRFNELTFECELDDEQLDFDSLRLRCAIDLNLDISKGDADSIFKEVAKRNSYHPIRDYLDDCYKEHGENTDILTGLAARVFGTSDPLYEVFLRKTLIAAIARIYQPACKVDHVLCLVGKQGYRKSSFFEALAGDFFTDNLDKDLNNKDNLMRLHRKWICEIGEIDRISSIRYEGDLKNFLTIKSDLMRLPYERTTKEFKRRFLFAGSSNRVDFLTDPTGDRRYWIIPVCRVIDTNFIKENRDQIWGAAVQLFKKKSPWWLSDMEKVASDRNNEKYRNASPLLPAIEAYLEGRNRVSVAEIMYDIASDISKHSYSLQRDITNTLQQLGWEKTGQKTRVNIGGTIKPVNTWVREGDQEGDHISNPYTVSNTENIVKSSGSEGDHISNPYTVSNTELKPGENTKKTYQTFLQEKKSNDDLQNNFEKSFLQKQGDHVDHCLEMIDTQGIYVDHLPDHPHLKDDHPISLDDDDEWIDIDSPVVPTKKALKTGDKVRYVGQKFANIYGNKELIINSVDGYEIDCLLPDGRYTTKFKIHDRDLELVRASEYF